MPGAVLSPGNTKTRTLVSERSQCGAPTGRTWAVTCSVIGRRHGLSGLITQGGSHDSRPREVLALLHGDPDLPVGPWGCGFH